MCEDLSWQEIFEGRFDWVKEITQMIEKWANILVLTPTCPHWSWILCNCRNVWSNRFLLQGQVCHYIPGWILGHCQGNIRWAIDQGGWKTCTIPRRRTRTSFLPCRFNIFNHSHTLKPPSELSICLCFEAPCWPQLDRGASTLNIFQLLQRIFRHDKHHWNWKSLSIGSLGKQRGFLSRKPSVDN